MSKLKKGTPEVFNPEAFKMKFKAGFACLMFIGCLVFIAIALFTKTGQAAQDAGTVIGFLTGTILATVCAYYFTNTDEKQAQLMPPVLPDSGYYYTPPDESPPLTTDKIKEDE